MAAAKLEVESLLGLVVILVSLSEDVDDDDDDTDDASFSPFLTTFFFGFDSSEVDDGSDFPRGVGVGVEPTGRSFFSDFGFRLSRDFYSSMLSF